MTETIKRYATPHNAYRLPRLLTILVSYVSFAFLIDLTQPGISFRKFIALIVGIIATGGVIYYQKQKKQKQYFTLLPLGLWAMLATIFMLRGFLPSIGLVRFIFLSVLAGLPTGLSYYTWKYNQLGGLVYVGMGLFYFLLAFNRVNVIPLATVVLTLVGTGLMLYYQPLIRKRLEEKSLVANQNVSDPGDHPQ